MKKRIFSLLLTCILMLSLTPVALAAELSEMPDVFQGDGVYITAKELPIPEGWSVNRGVQQGISEGLVSVTREVNVQDENGFYTGTAILMNWVDEEGNLFDFSDWKTPPRLGMDADYSFHDGLCYFYDREVGGYGYIDTEGNKVLEAEAGKYGIIDFYNGLLKIDNNKTFVDKTGEVVFSLEERGWDGTIVGEYSDGLFAYRGYLDADRDTYFSGWLNLDGEPVITLYSGDALGYSDAGEPYPSSTFSEGYGFYTIYPNGQTYATYVFIDTKGNEILTLEPEAPVFINQIGGGENFRNHDPGLIQNGRFWVYYTDTTPGIDYTQKTYAVLMDLEGNELFRTTSHDTIAGHFNNGVAVQRASNDALVIDMDGDIVMPRFSVGKESGGGFNITIGFNEDNQTLGVLSGRFDEPDTYYIMELHQGTYTGPGKVYNAATGQITSDGTTTPVQPESNTPSAWAEEQVNTAISNGIVPETLQSEYTQATTRAEFCALAVDLYETVKGTEITERATFTDTTDLNVQKMAGLGVVNGVGGGRFDANGTLTREQAATMLSRLAEAMGKPLTAQAPTFADNASISSWAADAVGQMQGSGVMGGVGNNTFSPQGSYTREQSIVTMLRLYEIVK